MNRKQQTKKSSQQGFTLIELVMVIVILGVLSATALPRFIDLSTDARKASMQGLAGSLRSAAAMAHAKAVVSQATGATGTISVEGESIALVYGYPAASSLFDMLSDTDGYTVKTSTSTVTADNGAKAASTCSVSYKEAESNKAPVITLSITDCS